MEEKNYLDFVPNEFKSVVRKHKCKYDIEKNGIQLTRIILLLKIFLNIQ